VHQTDATYRDRSVLVKASGSFWMEENRDEARDKRVNPLLELRLI